MSFNNGTTTVLPVGTYTDGTVTLNDSMPSIEPLVQRVKEELGLKPKAKPLCTCAVISTHEKFKFQHEDFCFHFIKGVPQ